MIATILDRFNVPTDLKNGLCSTDMVLDDPTGVLWQVKLSLAVTEFAMNSWSFRDLLVCEISVNAPQLRGTFPSKSQTSWSRWSLRQENHGSCCLSKKAPVTDRRKRRAWPLCTAKSDSFVNSSGQHNTIPYISCISSTCTEKGIAW